MKRASLLLFVIAMIIIPNVASADFSFPSTARYELIPDINERIASSDIVVLAYVKEAEPTGIQEETFDTLRNKNVSVELIEINADVLKAFKGMYTNNIQINAYFESVINSIVKYPRINTGYNLLFINSNNGTLIPFDYHYYFIYMPKSIEEIVELDNVNCLDDFLLQLLHSNRRELVIIAIKILSDLQGIDSVGLIKNFINSEDNMIKFAALFSLLENRNYPITDVILDNCNISELNSEIRPYCDDIIHYIDLYHLMGTTPYIISHYDHNNYYLKWWSIVMMSAWGDKQSLPLLASCLNDDDFTEEQKFDFCATGMQRIIGHQEYADYHAQAQALGQEAIALDTEGDIIKFWKNWWERNSN